MAIFNSYVRLPEGIQKIGFMVIKQKGFRAILFWDKAK